MDKLLGKVVDKVVGDDDERPHGLQQGGGNLTHGGSYPAGGGYAHPGDDDLRGAASVAAKEAPEDQDFFANAIAKLLDNKKHESDDDIDEQGAVESHRQFFGFGDSSSSSSSSHNQPASTSSLGSAAAVQALKLFTSSSSSSSSSQSQNAFVGLAMAQAAKLFDAQAAQGKVEPGADKQSVVMKAGEMALKMYLKSHGGAQQQEGGSGGAAAGLLNLAGKFLK
ncbi:hypothetical protein VTG60DRAFT_1235 [Thermothelomyces hinnuleus]